MKLFKLAPIVAALAITAAPVAAEEVNGLTYNRAGIGYGSASINGASDDGVSIDGDASGVGIELQAVVAENFVLGFGYIKQDGDLTARSVKFDFENTDMSLTFGYRFGVAQGTDVVPFLRYTNSDGKLNGQSVDDNTTTYGLRLNTRLSETAQATIGFRTDGKDDEFGKAFDVGLLFKVQPTVGLGLGYTLINSDSNDVKTWTATVEYLF